MSRLGRISYGRTTELIELPRPDWAETVKKPEVADLLEMAIPSKH
jgi:hypothetical protein